MVTVPPPRVERGLTQGEMCEKHALPKQQLRLHSRVKQQRSVALCWDRAEIAGFSIAFVTVWHSVNMHALEQSASEGLTMT